MKLKNSHIIIIIMTSVILIGTVIFFITRTKDNYVISHEKFSNKLTIKDLISQGKINPNGTYKYLTASQIQENKIREKTQKKFFVNKLLSTHKFINFKRQHFLNLAKAHPKPPPMIKFGKMQGHKDQKPLDQKPLYQKPLDQKDQKPLIENYDPADNESRMAERRADKKCDDYLKAMDDAQSDAISRSLTALYGCFQCDDATDPHCTDAAIRNLALQIGIGLLEIGLAVAGLGFLNSGISAIFAPDTAPKPIDYDRIKSIITDALVAQHLKNFIDDINIQIANVNNSIKTYQSLKSISTQSVCADDVTSEDFIKCMKAPVYGSPRIKFDPSLIDLGTGTIDGEVDKRTYLNKLLKSGAIATMVTQKDKLGINGIIKHGSTSAAASTELYSTFKLIIGFNIVYYQELSVIDMDTPNGINYVNPWMSKYIGNPSKVGRAQPAGSLLGELEVLCQQLFDYLKGTYNRYHSNLFWSNHSDCCDAWCPGTCTRWSNFQDTSTCMDAGWFWLIGQKWGNPLWSSNMTNILTDPQVLLNIYGAFLMIFDNYMNFPFTQLQVLKKMAGIKWLVGEENFTIEAHWWKWPYTTNNHIIYDTDTGGFPFGSSRMSYKQAIDSYNNPGNYDSNNSVQLGSSYCTPLIAPTIDSDSLDCGVGFSIPGYNKFDATVFNISGDTKTYKDNMFCRNGQGAISCVKPGRSPGTSTGIVEQNSRTAYCVDPVTNETSELVQYNNNTSKKCQTNVFQMQLQYYPSGEIIVLQVSLPGKSQQFLEWGAGRKPYGNQKLPSISSTGKSTGEKSDLFDITIFIDNLISACSKPDLKMTLPSIYGKIILNLPIDKLPVDPGTVNTTTRPPVNMTASVDGYPIEILSAKTTRNNIIDLSFVINKD